MGETSIEWTDRTWNPVRGCSRVSEGCRYCYAEAMAARNLPEMRSPTTGKAFAVRGAHGPQWTGKVELIPSKLAEPLRWRTPQRVFVNSMSDLFHEALDFRDIAAVYGVMSKAPQHTFQVLTKRPERRQAFMRWIRQLQGDAPKVGAYANDGIKTMATDPILGCEIAAGNRGVRFGARSPQYVDRTWPLPNVWEGVSVEDQATADTRIPILLNTPAAVRFVSYEPALGPVDFNRLETLCRDWRRALTIGVYLDLVIVGGESGPGARPCNVDWVRTVVRQCHDTRTAAFVKQLGARPLITDSSDPTFPVLKLHDRKGGDPEEWPPDLRVREFPL